MSNWDKLWFDFASGSRRPLTYDSNNKWARVTTDDWTANLGANSATFVPLVNENGEWAFRQKTTGSGERFVVWNRSGDTYSTVFIQCELRPLEEVNDNFGILFRLSSAVASSTGYRLSINTEDNNVKLMKKDGTNSYSAVSGADVSTTIEKNKKYLLAVYADATRIRAWLDGKLMFDVAEATYTAAGRVGLAGNVACEFRNLFVTDLHYPIQVRASAISSLAASEIVDYWIPVSANLASNGGFESSSTGVKNGTWDNWATQVSNVVEVVSSPVRTGTRAVRVAGTSVNNVLETATADRIVINQNKTYLFEADIRIASASTPIVAFREYDGSAVQLAETTIGTITETSRWVRVSKLFTPQDWNKDTAKIGLNIKNNSASSDFTVDNVSVRECVPVVMLPQLRTILSGEALS